jgi:hypothetical protein
MRRGGRLDRICPRAGGRATAGGERPRSRGPAGRGGEGRPCPGRWMGWAGTRGAFQVKRVRRLRSPCRTRPRRACLASRSPRPPAAHRQPRHARGPLLPPPSPLLPPDVPGSHAKVPGSPHSGLDSFSARRRGSSGLPASRAALAPCEGPLPPLGDPGTRFRPLAPGSRLPGAFPGPAKPPVILVQVVAALPYGSGLSVPGGGGR